MTGSLPSFFRKLFLLSILFTAVSTTSIAWAGFDINKASAEEIQSQVDGIGPKKARAIVDYRKRNGKFSSLSDLQNVPGIGEKTITKIQKSSGKKLSAATKKNTKASSKKADALKGKTDKKVAVKKGSATTKAKVSGISYKEETAKKQKALAKQKKSREEKVAKKSSSKKDTLAKAKRKSTYNN